MTGSPECCSASNISNWAWTTSIAIRHSSMPFRPRQCLPLPRSTSIPNGSRSGSPDRPRELIRVVVVDYHNTDVYFPAIERRHAEEFEFEPGGKQRPDAGMVVDWHNFDH